MNIPKPQKTDYKGAENQTFDTHISSIGTPPPNQTQSVWVLSILLLVLFLSTCQSDKPIEESTTTVNPLPPSSEDYEINPYQWGFINQTGTLVIADQFDEVRAFSDGLALVRQNGRWGYVNHRGQLQIPCQYKAAWSFNDNMARVQNENGDFGYIDISGKQTIKPAWKEAANFKEGLACVRVENKYGFINKVGQMIIKTIYDRSSSFKNAYAVVKKQGGYGMIDQDGNTIIPFEYQRLKAFSNGLARASQDNKYGFLNKHGQWQIEPKFIQAADFKNELAPAFDGRKWGLINKKGEWVVEPSYNQLYWAAKNRWIAEVNNLYQLIDEKANVLASDLEEIHPFKENFAPYKKRELWGFLNMEGQPNTLPLYYLVWPYHDGLARVATEYGLTFIDTAGFLLLSPNPDHLELQEFNEGLAPVQVYRGY